MNNDFQTHTLIIAIWGAITGTIALLLKYLDTLKDKPSLNIQPEFIFSFPLPNIVNFNVKIVNDGKMPTVLNYIYTTRKRKTFKEYFSKKEKIYLFFNLEKEIGSGELKKYYVDRESLNKKVDLKDVEKVVVTDLKGRRWKSKSKYQQDEAHNHINAKCNDVKEYNIGKKYINIKIFSYGKKFLVQESIRKENNTYEHKRIFFNSYYEAKIYFDELSEANYKG